MFLGASYGVRGAFAFTLGTSLGFTAVLVVSAMLVFSSMAASPTLLLPLKLAASAYTCWLAWKFMRGALHAGEGGTSSSFHKLGFLDGAGQQLANPRGWILASVTLAGFGDPLSSPIVEGLRMSMLYAAVGMPTALIWACLGAAGLATHSKLRRFLGVLCAAMLVYSVSLIWLV